MAAAPVVPPATRFPESSSEPRPATALADAVAADLGVGPGPEKQPPISVRRLVIRFALAGIPALIAVIVITAIASVRIGTRLGIDDARRISFVAATLVQEQGLEDGLLTGDPVAIAAVDDVVRTYVIRGYLVRVKLHSVDGEVLYSNDSRLIGQRFPMGDEELAILDGTNEVEAEVSDLSKEENALETEGKLLEVYRRVETPNGTPVLFEAYFRYDDVRNTGLDLWRQFAPIAVGALLVLELVQIPIALSMARRLRQGQEQRERLLQHAIESSDAERRRIASDLHDGAVQDLTGVSMSLSAAARKSADPNSRDAMGDAGSKIRETVKSLRSMLVDIYPPNLHEEGLQSALADLLGSVNNRGVRTRLDVAPEASQLSREAVSLLYRSAQETLRNVVTHAYATEVSVTVVVDGHRAVLVVDDDGVGFDPEVLANRAKRGHVGLRSLVGLIQDAGGQIEVRSMPGVGTRVEVVVPR
ncbi:MAG: sensor histidine kinase [Actinobacteria bacterium]|nr:sensor histidine kinase [Actinomycetota bacterium]